MRLQRGQSLLAGAVVWCLALLFAGGAYAGPPPGDSLMVADFEAYTDTDELRADWDIIDPPADPQVTLDLECSDGSYPPGTHCYDHHYDGPAGEGNQYLRINYLLGVTVARLTVNGMSDWSGWPFLRIYYRGRPWGQNGLADMQIVLIGNGGANVLSSPLAENATDCSASTSDPLMCDWSFFDMDLRGWPGLVDVDEVRIVVSGPGEGNGRLYIDGMQLRTYSPVPVRAASWGAVKAMYR